jgi:hypothetical protein
VLSSKVLVFDDASGYNKAGECQFQLEIYLLPCPEKLARTCHSERSEESVAHHGEQAVLEILSEAKNDMWATFLVA